ncbi:NAD(P)/FAD-dependent oxidoreductase [Terasakiella pusilla]|uniref:NAD(P)/FAD-dependent oxidoreductase n=1 Tax=Terasakiella pusilla TaxID=64973 RepID=UPI003AA9CC60
MQSLSNPHTMKIAVIGTGIAGMSASWLLSTAHDVTIYEKDDRIGGHTNTVDVDGTGVDTGFIVYNEKNYPNLIALFDHFGVETQKTDMSFGVSVGNGEFEYAGTNLFGMLAQKRNILRPRFWFMLRDILRFYREAPDLLAMDQMPSVTLGDFLKQKGYSESFQRDHLLPMGAAIWSTPIETMMDYPLESFMRFCDNHGLLQLNDRPQWRTVVGGSREYIKKLTSAYKDKIKINCGAVQVWHEKGKVFVEDRQGGVEIFDHVVLACHADQSLELLRDIDGAEKKLLSAFSYQPNKAILHTDASLMPKNRKAWSSWNYLSETTDDQSDVCVTYWMNNLQHIDGDTDYFVTLNPTHMPKNGHIIRSFLYHHPLFDKDAVAAQRMLWNIQGKGNIWFCGSYFGHGFHEDALQSGLAVAEALGGVRRPWMVENESGRIHLPADWPNLMKREAA